MPTAIEIADALFDGYSNGNIDLETSEWVAKDKVDGIVGDLVELKVDLERYIKNGPRDSKHKTPGRGAKCREAEMAYRIALYRVRKIIALATGVPMPTGSAAIHKPYRRKSER